MPADERGQIIFRYPSLNWPYVVATVIVFITLITPPKRAATESVGFEPERGKNVLAQCWISRRGRGVSIPVTVFGETHSFLVDTGASVSCLDSQFKDRLGPPVGVSAKVYAAGHSIRQPRFRAPEMVVGGFALPETSIVLCMDLSIMRDEQGAICSGVIGMDVLRSFVVQMDLDRGVLLLMDSVPADAGEPVALVCEEQPVVTVDVAGLGPRHFLVDTGSMLSNGVQLDQQGFDNLVDAGKIDSIDCHGTMSLGGGSVQKSGTLEQVKLGCFVHKRCRVACSYARVIGTECLFQYNITFDFPGGTMFLKERARHQIRTNPSNGVSLLARLECASNIRAYVVPIAGATVVTFIFVYAVRIPRSRRRQNVRRRDLPSR